MPSQLFQLTEHGHNILASRRNTLLLATGILAVGGAAAFMQSRNSGRKVDYPGHYNGLDDSKEKPDKMSVNDKKVREGTQKRGGLKSLHILARILLSEMGQMGVKDLLSMIAISDDLRAVTDGLLYTWRLCSYASLKEDVLCILVYVLGAGVMIKNFSPAFGKLMSKEQQLEGEYRELHSRLRIHAESIAFYGGETREENHI